GRPPGAASPRDAHPGAPLRDPPRRGCEDGGEGEGEGEGQGQGPEAGRQVLSGPSRTLRPANAAVGGPREGWRRDGRFAVPLEAGPARGGRASGPTGRGNRAGAVAMAGSSPAGPGAGLSRTRTAA